MEMSKQVKSCPAPTIVQFSMCQDTKDSTFASINIAKYGQPKINELWTNIRANTQSKKWDLDRINVQKCLFRSFWQILIESRAFRGSALTKSDKHINLS